MEKTLNGSQADINIGGPHRMEVDSDGAGHPLIQYDSASLADTQTKPFNVLPFNEGTGKPLIQWDSAEQAPIDRTPIRGWQSDYAPMSERAWKAGE